MPDDTKILEEIKRRFELAYEYVDELYELCIDDLRFLEGGSQWPADVKKDRETDGRPCLEINKLASFADQITGDIRMNSPAIKVKPVDSKADPDTAEKMTGLIRNIENQSRADIAYDTASESSVECGKGTFRVITQYVSEDSFEQEIRMKRMKNPFTVFWDPQAQEWDKSDAKYCFVTERISREEFEEQYPDAAMVEFKTSKDKNYKWGDDKSIRVAEYWRVSTEKTNLYLLRDPVTGNEVLKNEKLDGWEIVKQRDVQSRKLTWYKTNGREILEGPQEWPGQYIPIIEVWGKELNVEGRSVYRGAIRHAKDPARLYNYSRSHNAEVTSLAPKAPYLVTGKMIANYLKFWKTAHKKNYPYLPYDPDPEAIGAGGIPKRERPITQNTGLLAEIQISDQEMHDTTGLQQASLGKESNEKSGKAIMARQREGDVANYAYYDNLARALMYAGRVIVDLIPHIYDTARIERILGEDDSEEQVQFNKPFIDKKTGKEMLFDLTVGKYDVIVSIGPSYSSQREEAADGMLHFFEVLPDPGKILVADLIVSNLDWPGADKFEERLKLLLPPQVSGGEDGQGPPPPPPEPPDPSIEAKALKDRAELEGRLLSNREKSIKVAQAESGGNV